MMWDMANDSLVKGQFKTQRLQRTGKNGSCQQLMWELPSGNLRILPKHHGAQIYLTGNAARVKQALDISL